MMNSTDTVTAVLASMIRRATLSAMVRRRTLASCLNFMGSLQNSDTAAGKPPDEKLRQNPEDDCDAEQDETDIDQGGHVEAVRSFRKLAGDLARHAVDRIKQRGEHLESISADQSDGHGLADGPAQSKDDGADQADPRVRKNGLPDGLPLVAPSANMASICERGTARSRSREIAVMIGVIMIARMIPAARTPTP